jgi:hypothetical protein
MGEWVEAQLDREGWRADPLLAVLQERHETGRG